MTSTLTTAARISVDVARQIARIVMHHPPLNVIDIPMMEELAQAFAEIEAQPGVAVVVLSGEGKAFSAGVDVAAHTSDNVEATLGKFHGVIRALVATKRVTIASVHRLPGWRRGVGDGLRPGPHIGQRSVGIS